MTSPPRRQLLSVLMPVYDEARTLRRIVAAVLASPVDLAIELICVDDGSRDKTPEILAELAAADRRIKVIRHPVNRGKGAAIRTAIEAMTGDIAIIQDADLEYDPREFPTVLAPILQGKADAVFGSRFAAGPQRKVLLYWHSVANRLLTWVTNVLNDFNITDMETCYKAVRSDILKQLVLKSDRFGIEPELTTRLAQWNLRLYEVPISYHGRTAAEGKKIGWRDAISAGWCLLHYRFLDTRFTTHDGYYLLQSARRAQGFIRWTFSQFHEHVGQRVCAAGCGIGNFTELLLDRERLLCVDSEPLFVEVIERRFGYMENVSAHEMDLTAPGAGKAIRPERPDTIISLNVIEHVERDRDVLREFFEALVPGGRAILLVPAHPSLYTATDRSLGHFRRYTPEDLSAKLRDVGFDVERCAPFNPLGALGWWLSGKLGAKELSTRSVQVFEWLLPLAKLLDKLGLGFGLSLIAVGRKPAH